MVYMLPSPSSKKFIARAWNEDLVMHRPAKLNHVIELMMVIASLVNRSEGDEFKHNKIEVLECAFNIDQKYPGQDYFRHFLKTHLCS